MNKESDTGKTPNTSEVKALGNYKYDNLHTGAGILLQYITSGLVFNNETHGSSLSRKEVLPL